MTDFEDAEVRAAGGIVWRTDEQAGYPVVAMIHRERYDDWSLPKGKLDDGESFEEAALREVEEEIGVRARLGEELPPASYRDNKGRSKVVRYWLMEIAVDFGFEPNDEVDEVRWVTPAQAVALATYKRDSELLSLAAEILA